MALKELTGYFLFFQDISVPLILSGSNVRVIFNARTIWGFYPVSYLYLLLQREMLIPHILSVLQKKTFPADIKCLQKEIVPSVKHLISAVSTFRGLLKMTYLQIAIFAFII